MAILSQDFKKTIPWAILFFALIGVIAFQWSVSKGAPRARSVTVVGECLGRAEKDTTAITLRIQTLGETGAQSMAMARSTYNAVSQMLGQFEGLEKQTSRWESFEKTRWDSASEQQVTVGIQTMINLDVSSKNARDIEDLLSRAERIENVFPENLRMSVSNEKLKPALEACVADAVQNARAKAETIAESEGAKIGEMLVAEYGRTADEAMPRPMLMRAVAADSIAGAGLFTTDAEFSVTVRATFQLK
ncbi:MAG: SIMPL domain-containing protein [Alphaproteobacteria bacterium]|nr:SIMPL domain-containing protein [Alphaproteobacteria bacterium]